MVDLGQKGGRNSTFFIIYKLKFLFSPFVLKPPKQNILQSKPVQPNYNSYIIVLYKLCAIYLPGP